MKYLKRINEAPFLYDFDEDEDDGVYKPSTEVQEDIDYIKTLLADIEDNIELSYEIDGSNYEGFPGDEGEEVRILVTSKDNLSISGNVIYGKYLNMCDSLPDYEIYLVGKSISGNVLRSSEVKGNEISQFLFDIKRTLYIKEELSPELLRNAGKKLMDYGHFKRGQEMINHAIKSSNPISLDMNYFLGDTEDNTDDIKLTNCVFDRFDLGISFEKIEHLESDINDAIESWKNGSLKYNGILCITTPLYFNVDQDIIKKEFGSEYMLRGINGSFNLVDIVFDISKKYDENNDTIDFKVSYIPNCWDVVDCHVGLPSDRKSAVNFKKIITDKIFKDKSFREILNRFISAAGSGDEYSDILKNINNLRVNYLYSDSGDIYTDNTKINSLNLLTGEVTESEYY